MTEVDVGRIFAVTERLAPLDDEDRVMRSISAVSAKNDFDDLLDTVADGGEPVEIVGGRHSAVLVDKRDYDSLLETLHLLSSPANAERLLSAVGDISQGRNLIQADIRVIEE